MRLPSWRMFVVELLGTFAVVFVAAGMVCVNRTTQPPDQAAATTALLGQYPGLVGLALAQGFILAAALAATMHVSGGFLNPAITVMLWVFNRLESSRAAGLLVAQLLGGLLAGLCLRCTFETAILADARLGTPHLNPLSYPSLQWPSLLSGAGIELLLTFFLVFAIFGAILKKEAWQRRDEATKGPRPGPDPALRTVDARLAGLVAGLTLSAGVLFGYPLTGAALNPARWFGTVVWEAFLQATPADRGPFADMFVYLAGPVLGALLAGLVYFRIMAPEQIESEPQPATPATTATTRAKK